MLLTVLLTGMIYVVTRPAYNFAHWVPHNFLRRIGVSYDQMLWAEQNADLALHFFGAAILVFLIYRASLPILGKTVKCALATVIVLCIGAEIVQFTLGRGVETSDLLLGILGGFMAYLAIDKK